MTEKYQVQIPYDVIIRNEIMEHNNIFKDDESMLERYVHKMQLTI